MKECGGIVVWRDVEGWLCGGMWRDGCVEGCGGMVVRRNVEGWLCGGVWRDDCEVLLLQLCISF